MPRVKLRVRRGAAAESAAAGNFGLFGAAPPARADSTAAATSGGFSFGAGAAPAPAFAIPSSRASAAALLTTPAATGGFASSSDVMFPPASPAGAAFASASASPTTFSSPRFAFGATAAVAPFAPAAASPTAFGASGAIISSAFTSFWTEPNPFAPSLLALAQRGSWTEVQARLSGWKGWTNEWKGWTAELLAEWNGWTILDLAAYWNMLPIVNSVVELAKAHGCLRELLEHNLPDVERSALFLAAVGDSDGALEILINAGADCFAADHNQMTAFLAAVMCGSRTTVRRLLIYAAQLDAARSDESGAAVVAVMAAQEASAPTSGASAGFSAPPAAATSASATAGMLRRMLTGRQREGWGPLSIAAWKGHASVVDDIVLAFHTLLTREGACATEQKTLLREFVNEVNGGVAAPSPAKEEPEATAAQAVRRLLRHTALHLAANAGKAGAITMLLKHGADPRAQDSRKQTPLQIAEAKGHLAAVGVFETHAGGVGSSMSPRVRALLRGNDDAEVIVAGEAATTPYEPVQASWRSTTTKSVQSVLLMGVQARTPEVPALEMRCEAHTRALSSPTSPSVDTTSGADNVVPVRVSRPSEEREIEVPCARI